jgi:G3E family GTPase
MRADYIMIGGFLGAGKTTALLRLAERLTAEGRRVGLITNDQSHGLVDTALVGSHGYPVQEITGGCFCCRFTSLVEAAERLTDEAKPDVLLAEPVGSCTDLRATVQYPLRRLYGDRYRIAPLSVLVDPIRALRVLGVEPGQAFSPKVRYVYGKQLEEAQIIVINKADLLIPDRQARLEQALAASYPDAELHVVSTRTGAGLVRWFERVTHSESDTRQAPVLDYDAYADGEARLGWFNATFHLGAARPFDGNVLLGDLGRGVSERLVAASIEIAHLKMVLTPDECLGDLAALNLVGNDRQPELSHELRGELSAGELIVNARGEGEPGTLRDAVHEALAHAAAGLAITIAVVNEEGFRPARPAPTYRMTTSAPAR